MAKVIFGVWDNKVIDNRGKKVFEIEEHPEFGDFDEFNPGNPIKAFLGGHGFFIFEKGVNLLDAALQYMERAAKEVLWKMHAVPGGYRDSEIQVERPGPRERHP